jgi:hypothetical protein
MGRSGVPTKLRIGAPREGVALCPPARMGRRGVPFETWCDENGERGAKLLEEWADTEKGPREVTKGSHHRAPWNCIRCGHEWRTTVGHRTKSKNPSDCPACAGKVATATHNLRLTCEESEGRLEHLLGEWNHPTKLMENFCPASNERVPWKCECGCGWNARISHRTRSERPSGCPGCSTPGVQATATHNLKLTCEESGGRLAHLLEEWDHPTKLMEDFTPNSGAKVPWKCGNQKCRGEWNARISDRTRSDRPTGCPKCNPPPPIPGIVATATHNLKLTCEESGGQLAHLLAEWNHPTKRPEDFCPGSVERVPWKCGYQKCGGEWNARIYNRTRSDRPSGCPGCNTDGPKTGKLIEL